jgi:hypothetical protein
MPAVVCPRNSQLRRDWSIASSYSGQSYTSAGCTEPLTIIRSSRPQLLPLMFLALRSAWVSSRGTRSVDPNRPVVRSWPTALDHRGCGGSAGTSSPRRSLRDMHLELRILLLNSGVCVQQLLGPRPPKVQSKINLPYLNGRSARTFGEARAGWYRH